MARSLPQCSSRHRADRPAADLLREGPRPLRAARRARCSSWPATGSRPTTTCCRRRSRTRAGCSPSCRCGGSSSSPTWCPTTWCPSTCPPRWPAAPWCASGSRCSRSSAWPAATSPAPGSSSTSPAARCAGSRCRRAWSTARGCRSRSSPPRPRRRWASTTRTSPSRPWWRPSARRTPGSCAASRWRSTRAPSRSPGTAASCSPTPSSSSAAGAPTVGSCSPTRSSRPTRRASGRSTSGSPGHAQPSFDKQYVRDWLVSPASGWDRASDAPPPPLPEAVVEATRAKYVEAYERLTGRTFA